jgi:crotonobetainyl-CoA:carnitine CoA-transferase CaiB-like acyl-CoA transferase
MPSTADAAPLTGYRVVDAASYLLGPFAAMMLADLGADVIKVEPPPSGDPYRRLGPHHHQVGLPATVVNRGKRSVTLDLKSPDGRDAFLALIGTADVFIHNWRPGVSERLALTDDVIGARNPRLVRAWVTGFGSDGPLAGQPAFDSLLQARTGLAHVQGHPGRPQMLRTYVADKVSATFAVQAVLAALLEREATGRGRFLELSMLEAVAYFNFPDVGAHRAVIGAARSLAPPPSRVLPCTDGYVAVAPVSGKQIRAALEAVGHPEWWEELKSSSTYSELGERLMDRLASATRTLSTRHCLDRFGAHDVPAAPVLDVDEHLRDPQVVQLGIYEDLDDPVLGRVRFARHPGRFTRSAHRPAPAPGEHTDEVLAEVDNLRPRPYL